MEDIKETFHEYLERRNIVITDNQVSKNIQCIKDEDPKRWKTHELDSIRKHMVSSSKKDWATIMVHFITLKIGDLLPNIKTMSDKAIMNSPEYSSKSMAISEKYMAMYDEIKDTSPAYRMRIDEMKNLLRQHIGDTCEETWTDIISYVTTRTRCY